MNLIQMTIISTTAFWVALVVKNLSANAGDIRDLGLIPAHRITKSQTQLSDYRFHSSCIYYCGQESLRRNGAALVVNESSKYSGGGGGLVAKSYPTLVTPWKVAHQDSLST